MYKNTAWDCASIRNYHAAERHFNETKPVKSRKSKWASDERPLRRRSQHHYRLKHGTWQGRNFYDLVHYQTTLVRYWEPFANGDAVVSLLYYHSVSSRDFMSAHNWGSLKTLSTTTGTETVYAGVDCDYGAMPHWFEGRQSAFGEHFSAHLVLTPEGKLDMATSVMVPMASPIVSDHRKAQRAAVRKQIAVIKDILLLQFNNLSQRDEVSYEYGRPFSRSKAQNSSEFRTISNLLWEQAFGAGLDSVQQIKLTQALVDVSNDVYDTLASRIAYSEGSVAPRWARPNVSLPTPTKPTYEQFIKAYERTVMSALRLDSTDDQRLLNGDGLFPPTSTYPRKAHFARHSSDTVNVLPARIDALACRLSKV